MVPRSSVSAKAGRWQDSREGTAGFSQAVRDQCRQLRLGQQGASGHRSEERLYVLDFVVPGQLSGLLFACPVNGFHSIGISHTLILFHTQPLLFWPQEVLSLLTQNIQAIWGLRLQGRED